MTFTGADDSTNIQELMEIRSPRLEVEWGILYNPHYDDVPMRRFPTMDWIDRLVAAWNQESRIVDRLSLRVQACLHVCGNEVRNLLYGESTLLPDWRFGRYQLNTSKMTRGEVLASPARITDGTFDSAAEIILGGDFNSLDAVQFSERGFNTLFDASGGRGSTRRSYWPDGSGGPSRGLRPGCGYAGGINPDNVAEILGDISQATSHHPCWIDMESGVRTNDQLDLGKCREVVRKVEAYLDHSDHARREVGSPRP